MAAPKHLPRTLSSCKVKPSSTDRKPIGRDLEISYFYENGFPYSVKVVTRSGLAITLPPHGNVGINNILNERVYDFVVRMKIKYSNAVKIDTNNILDGASEDNRELMAMAQAVSQCNEHLAKTVYDFSMDYSITREQFEEAGNQGVYIPEVDLTICPSDVVNVVHPNSAQGAAIKANESKELVGFLYRIEIVDPYDQYGVRFVNIAGKIDRVYPVKDVKRQPGVYVHRVMRASLNEPADIKPEMYSFEEATKLLRLYRTEDEARSLGDLVETQKRDYEQKVLELKNTSLELETKLRDETTRAKTAAAEADAKRKELEELRDVVKSLREEKMLKLKEEIDKRSLHREDYYEQRSYARKDDSEWVKWGVAAVIGGGLLAYKLFWD